MVRLAAGPRQERITRLDLEQIFGLDARHQAHLYSHQLFASVVERAGRPSRARLIAPVVRETRCSAKCRGRPIVWPGYKCA